jgi:tRNA threonylcarbamoyladenosine biosynthesis protein TsaB
MILALDTSSPITKLRLLDFNGDLKAKLDSDTGNELSGLLLNLIEEILIKNDIKLNNLTGLILAIGPGGFTGLRIGASTMNALAYALNIPIVGVIVSSNWLQGGTNRLRLGNNDKIVKLEYGADAHITKQKK